MVRVRVRVGVRVRVWVGVRVRARVGAEAGVVVGHLVSRHGEERGRRAQHSEPLGVVPGQGRRSGARARVTPRARARARARVVAARRRT